LRPEGAKKGEKEAEKREGAEPPPLPPVAPMWAQLYRYAHDAPRGRVPHNLAFCPCPAWGGAFLTPHRRPARGVPAAMRRGGVTASTRSVSAVCVYTA